jgi:uncharacterized membrane protein
MGRGGRGTRHASPAAIGIAPVPNIFGALMAVSSQNPPDSRTATSNASVTPAGDPLAKALGWVSIGLGAPMLLRPDAVTRTAGVGDGQKQRTVAVAVGVRELVHAAGLLTPRLRPRWVWTRVVGDAMDLAVLGRALRRHDGRGFRRTAAATAAVAGITAVDIYAAARSRRSRPGETSVELTAATTVRKDPAEVYAFWRQLENLPAFMAHVEEVRANGRRSHWRVRAPFGKNVEWDAEIVDDIPGERLSWRSDGNSAVSTSGTVRFVPAPGGRGTEVHVALSYDVPGRKLGEALARWAGEDPHQQLDDDLRRFKQVMETGEVVRSEGAPWGKRARREFPQHPARPLTSAELAREARS